MNKIFAIPTVALFFTLYACTNPQSTQITAQNEDTVYYDTPFIQEYHEGFVIDEENTKANDVRSVAVAPSGEVWAATGNGVYRKAPENSQWQPMMQGEDQGPAYDVDFDDNAVWVATWNGVYTYTAGSLQKDEYSVRHSRRWLLSDQVRDIAFDASGNAWIATAAGVSAIKRREMTLADKAAYFYDRLIRRHVREPWIVARFRLQVPGDTTTITPEDDQYQQAYRRLIEEEGYLENSNSLYTTNPAWKTYFDTYLAAYVYPALILYEEEPALQQAYRDHMEEWFQTNQEAKSPMVNFLYNYLTGGHEELENAIYFLKDAPLDLVDWPIDNGAREDLKVVREPILEELQTHVLRPPSEYRTIRWDKNPWVTISGNPAEEKEPVYWLLPYWLGRYLGLIAENN